MPERWDAAVVGGGIGGLTAAALLARAGKRVAVYEAEAQLGGFQCSLEIGGATVEPHFHFLQDAGPGRPARVVLDRAGVDVDWIPIDPLVDLHFPDGRFTVPADRGEFIALLKREFPHQKDAIHGFFATTAALHAAAQDRSRVPPILARHGGDTVADLVQRHVADPRLRTILGAWAAYFGYGAAHISGVAIAVFTERCFLGGVLHPAGGIGAVREALRVVIEEAGGTVRCGAPVASIEISDGAATGLVLEDGKRVSAEAVLSSADVVTTLRDLAGRPDAVERLERVDRFRSPFTAVALVRSGESELTASSPVKVVFPNDDTDAQDHAQMAGEMDAAPVSIGIPTMQNPALAPAGHDVALLYTFWPRARIDELQRDTGAAEEAARRLVAVAGRRIDGLERSAEAVRPSTEVVPGIYRPATAGALGWAPTPAALLGSPAAARALASPVGGRLGAAAAAVAPGRLARLAERSPIPGPATPIERLYLCGQWTRTGPGMNNVIVSAAAAADEVL